MDQNLLEQVPPTDKTVRFERSKIPNEHGLCEAAETHWAVYLIQLINNKVQPTIHTLEANGKSVSYLIKGEELSDSGFTFGADSMLVIDSQEPILDEMIFIQEDIGVFVGRDATSLSESLEINGYSDDSIQSRWKGVVRDFLQQNNIDAQNLTLAHLVSQALNEKFENSLKSHEKSRNIFGDDQKPSI